MGYQLTRPDADQLKFNSSTTGEHVIDEYLESAEIGGRSLPSLLGDVFDPSGNLRTLATATDVANAIAAAATAAYQAGLAEASAVAAAASAASIAGGPVTSVAGKNGIVTLVKGDVGLGNVDNTSDANKPVSSATQTALNLKAAFGVQTFSGAQRGAFVVLTDAATVAIDLALANQFRLVLGGNRTLGVPSNIVEGQQGVINVSQDPTGSRTLAYSWVYQWSGGTVGVLSTPGCSRDMLAYSVDFYKQANFTVGFGANAVFTSNGHGMVSGQKVQLSTTNALYTGLAVATTYFVRVIDANTFYLATSLANCAAGTYIATSGTQNGTHTFTACSITMALAKAVA